MHTCERNNLEHTLDSRTIVRHIEMNCTNITNEQKVQKKGCKYEEKEKSKNDLGIKEEVEEEAM